MSIVHLALVGLLAAASPAEDSVKLCKEEIPIDLTLSFLRELPEEIQVDLREFSDADLAESGTLLLETDAPTSEDSDKASGRFLGAYLVDEKWYVFYELALYDRPRMIGYQRSQSGLFRRNPLQYFGGHICAVLKAANDGVISPRD